ncbi:MAG: hypothetical protein JXQ29_04955 [Planctomycetes bacterium]|nr:hypothetical protein [Planctomycetota bacterium]
MSWAIGGAAVLVAILLWIFLRPGEPAEREVSDDVDDMVLHDLTNPDDDFDVGR